MADALRLLFELDVDSRSGTAGLLRFRKDIAATIEAARRAITQPLKTLNTAPATAAISKASVATQELANRNARAAQASQRLQIGQQRLAVATTQVTAAQQRAATAIQRAATAQTQAAAGAIRASTAFQRATAAANSFAQSLNSNLTRALASVQSGLRSLGSGLQSIGRTLTVGITAPILALGAASLKSAKDLDANVNTLKAFTGSAAAAEVRLAQLIKTARGTPGLTTTLALTLDAQLRIAQTTQQTIDRVLPAIGRLNAVSKLPDAARFTQNLLQLVTQNFEKQDLKELVGQSPLAGQLLTEIFKVDSPTNAKAIREQAKKLGLTSVDAFFNAFADAAARNQGLATVTESIGTRFDKVVDRVTVALRPLGLAILKAIEPFVEPVARLIERIGAAFDSLSEPVKTAIIVIAGIAAAAGPVLFVLGGLATGITAVVSAIGTIAAAVAAVGLPAIAAAVGGIIILITEWAVILGALGLAWQKNFLGIRDLVSEAGSAVFEAFTRIKAIIDEATQRILPTLQSITTKVLGIITLVWERYGKVVVAVVGTAFRFILSVTENFLKNFTDFVDLVLKLVDGDWKGAWSAFSRIVIRAVEQVEFVLVRLNAIVLTALLKLNQAIVRGAVNFAIAAEILAAKFIAAFVSALLKADRAIRDALIDALILAVKGMDVTTIGAVMVGKLLAAMRKAAAQGVTVPIEFVPQDNLQRIELNPDGSIKTKKTPPPGGGAGGKDKGADAETKRRIRLLELEAERTEAINRQNIEAERLRFELKEKSLKQVTEDEIRLEQEILEKKRKIFAAELIEAQKLGKGRELAEKEINLKSLQAEIEFHNKVNQLRVNQRKEEERAAIEHRQKLLDIQERGEAREIARLEELSKTGRITAFERERRVAEIEADARRRRRGELEKQLEETKENKEERGRIQDELAQFDEESAEATEEAERRKREALQETVRAFNSYKRAITDAIAETNAAIRDVVRIALERPEAAFNLGRQRIIKAQFKLRQRELAEDRKAAQQRIDAQEQDAIDQAKLTGDFEKRQFEIEETFRRRRLAADRQFNAERRALQEEEQRELERANPNSTRSLFGDTFADAANAIREAARSAGEAVSSLTVILGSFGAAAAEHFANASAQAGNFISTLLEGIDNIVAGLGDMLANWVLLGETGAAAFRKLIASTLAYYARTFLIKALDNIGEGFSNLAKASAAAASGNLVSAALYKAAAVQNFISAAKYGIASAATAVAGRFAAGDSFKQKDTARRAVNGGEDAEPRNRTFNFGGGGPVESSSQATRDGSGGVLGRLVGRIESLQQQNLELQRQQQLQNAQVAQALTKFNTASPGDVVTMGAQQRPDSIGVAVIDHSNSSGDFNEKLQRNLGFA
jgi:hypothetical protein